LSASRLRTTRTLRRPAPLALAVVLALAIALALAGGLPGSGSGPAAAAAPGFQEATPQTDASVPANSVTMIGATPEEPGAPGANETWGVGSEGKTIVLVRYDLQSGPEGEEGAWTLGPALPEKFELEPSPLAGQMTPKGFGVLAGTEPGGTNGQVLLVRRPGGGFEETAHVPTEGEEPEPEDPLLTKGQRLFGLDRPPMIAPLEEKEGGEAGALVAPVSEGPAETVEKQILHWDGRQWSSEPIAIPSDSTESFRVLAIGATSTTNAWLLARLSSGSIALFRRTEEESGHWSWKPVPSQGPPGKEEAQPLTVPVLEGPVGGEPFSVPGASSAPLVKGQLLTVTADGVWIDGARGDVEAHAPATTTIFFKPDGLTGGEVQASWCELPAGTPAGTPRCQHELPEALPTGFSRSIAWTGGGPYGERVITGLPEGVSLRLEGETFERVRALGGGEEDSSQDPGSALGSAFTSPTEGWLGTGSLPVHLTLKPQLSRLAPWPVSFRRPLLAIAPEPGAPVASLESEALAVGELGAVARFKPGEGWLPETLFGPGERVETPRLRAVAWPRPNRAYAVGDEGEMWLWRGETGLWERDPATPINFRGNLNGIAFDPNNPARGYAVGTSEVGHHGVLLRYGKSWTEETELPAQVQNASFTAIAFAGSEAIVAYREKSEAGSNTFVGGLLVNEGSGWRVEPEAATAIGNGYPAALAALPDGGAAMVVQREGKHDVFEREGAGAPWLQTPTPLPPETQPGSLALFREAGSLRAIVTAGGIGIAGEQAAPAPGFPPNLTPPTAIVAGAESGGVLRQTSAGWSDEGHELNPARAPAVGFNFQDLPYRPDPIYSVLIDPTGTQGWAVGGLSGGEKAQLDTGDVARYPAGGVTPLGSGSAPVALRPEREAATFAFGGDAECAAPCADRLHAGVGPQVWLAAAVKRAREIGAAGFFDTGPSLTEGRFSGAKSPPIPFQSELERVAEILGSSSPFPVYDVASPPDLDARPESEGTEASFENAFSGFPVPFGGTPLDADPAALTPAGGAEKQCGAAIGCESAYYSLLHDGVRVIVLDDSAQGEVDESQRAWLQAQLEEAGRAGEPVIAVANADLGAEVAAREEPAIKLLAALVGEDPDGQDPGRYAASAYFYDAPEENVQRTIPYVGSEGTKELPVFGSGTLGYEEVLNEAKGDFHGAKGMLLGEVDLADREAHDRAKVQARLIPVIGELALEAPDGVLLQRSKPALFNGLARRPRAGCRAAPNETSCTEDQYIPIPSVCVGAACQTAVLPEYEFTSSEEHVGGFVERNTASSEPHAVLQNAAGEPIREPGSARSGLFCAYNAGETTVSIIAGGLKASLKVVVQKGSVRQPCGTVPLRHQVAASQNATAPVPPPAPAPAPAGPAPASAPAPVPLPPPPAVIPPSPVRPPPRTPPPPFFFPPALTAPVLAFVPPPVPTPARPTPPSGTSAVTSPIEVAEHEEEEESATESVSNQALVYSAPEHEPRPLYVLGVVLLAAFAGASVLRPRRGRRQPRIAPATLNGSRAQRRMTAGERRRRW